MDQPTDDLQDPARWLEGLRSAYARALADGAARWRRARAAVERGDASPDTLAEAALLALETMGPNDPTSLGMSACEALVLFGGSEHLDRLRAARPRLPARKGLRDWRVDADRALQVMRARAAGQCTCAAEAARGAPVHGEQWRVESEQVDASRYCVTMVVRCTRCESTWSVERDDGYHYPTFRWSRT